MLLSSGLRSSENGDSYSAATASDLYSEAYPSIALLLLGWVPVPAYWVPVTHQRMNEAEVWALVSKVYI